MPIERLTQLVVSKSDGGFTLVETLLVLFIISCTFLIPVLAIDKMIEQTTVDLFLREMTGNLTMMQNHAILNGEGTMVQFSNDKDNGTEFIDFTIRQQPNHRLNKRQVLNTDYYSLRNNEPKVIYFKSHSGNISESGNVRFRSVNGDYRLIFWLGSGRFEVTRTPP